MSEEKEFLTEKQSMKSLVTWMNENYVKQTGKQFTVGDIQFYIKRGYIPEYLGKNTIERDSSIKEAKLYNVIK